MTAGASIFHGLLVDLVASFDLAVTRARVTRERRAWRTGPEAINQASETETYEAGVNYAGAAGSAPAAAETSCASAAETTRARR
jgi:hypothetical protein